MVAQFEISHVRVLSTPMSNGKQNKSSEVGLTKTKPKTTQNSKIMVGMRYATVLVVAGGAIWAAAQIEDKSELLPPQSVVSPSLVSPIVDLSLSSVSI